MRFCWLTRSKACFSKIPFYRILSILRLRPKIQALKPSKNASKNISKNAGKQIAIYIQYIQNVTPPPPSLFVCFALIAPHFNPNFQKTLNLRAQPLRFFFFLNTIHATSHLRAKHKEKKWKRTSTKI